MNIIFDTSAIIDLARQEKWILDEFPKLKNHQLLVSVISLAEIKIGLHLSKNKSEVVMAALDKLIASGLIKIVNVDTNVANQYAKLQNDMRKIGTQLGSFDGLIAATALEYKTTLVTSDSDFKRIKQLKLITP